MIKVKSLLTDIRKSEKPLELVTNGGPFVADLIGSFMNEVLVWYSQYSVANFLGSHQLAKKLRIACDTEAEDAMHVHFESDKHMKFESFGAGLCAYDARKQFNHNKP